MSHPGIDLNLVVLRGRLAAEPELREFDTGSRLIRYLVTIRSDHPKRRVDVIPVTLWDPADDLWDHPGEKKQPLWMCGSTQRRFWEGPEGRRSRVEVVAEHTIMGSLEVEAIVAP